MRVWCIFLVNFWKTHQFKMYRLLAKKKHKNFSQLDRVNRGRTFKNGHHFLFKRKIPLTKRWLWGSHQPPATNRAGQEEQNICNAAKTIGCFGKKLNMWMGWANDRSRVVWLELLCTGFHSRPAPLNASSPGSCSHWLHWSWHLILLENLWAFNSTSPGKAAFERSSLLPKAAWSPVGPPPRMMDAGQRSMWRWCPELWTYVRKKIIKKTAEATRGK